MAFFILLEVNDCGWVLYVLSISLVNYVVRSGTVVVVKKYLFKKSYNWQNWHMKYLRVSYIELEVCIQNEMKSSSGWN